MIKNVNALAKKAIHSLDPDHHPDVSADVVSWWWWLNLIVCVCTVGALPKNEISNYQTPGAFAFAFWIMM